VGLNPQSARPTPPKAGWIASFLNFIRKEVTFIYFTKEVSLMGLWLSEWVVETDDKGKVVKTTNGDDDDDD